MRRYWIVPIILLCMLCTAVMAAAPKDTPVKVFINGCPQQLKPAAFIRDGKTVYLPLTATIKAAKGTVKQDKAKKTYTVKCNKKTTTVKVSQGIKSGSDLMVPIDVMKKSIDGTVTWDAPGKAVRITLSPPKGSAPKPPASGST